MAVAEEKMKKQQAAALKAEELRRHAVQVAEVEREARKAREEVQVVSRGGKAVKKNFLRPSGDVSISPLIMRQQIFLSIIVLPAAIDLPLSRNNTTRAVATKRNVDSARLSEPGSKKPKATKYVASRFRFIQLADKFLTGLQNQVLLAPTMSPQTSCLDLLAQHPNPHSCALLQLLSTRTTGLMY